MAFIFVKRVIVYLKTCGNLTGLIDNKKGFFISRICMLVTILMPVISR